MENSKDIKSLEARVEILKIKVDKGTITKEEKQEHQALIKKILQYYSSQC